MHSKWYYVTVGFSAFGAIVGAMAGIPVLMIIESVLVVVYWYMAERVRKEEDFMLIEAYLASKQEPDETTNEDKQ